MIKLQFKIKAYKLENKYKLVFKIEYLIYITIFILGILKFWDYIKSLWNFELSYITIYIFIIFKLLFFQNLNFNKNVIIKYIFVNLKTFKL